MTNEFYKALEFALKAHAGKLDKGGNPYILHPVHVASKLAEACRVEETQISALLQDVVEDTSFTLKNIFDMFGKHIANHIDHLTRRESESYKDYIIRLSEDKIAVQVKLEDLRHNMDLSRISNPTKEDFKRIDKYQKWYDYLLNERTFQVGDKCGYSFGEKNDSKCIVEIVGLGDDYRCCEIKILEVICDKTGTGNFGYFIFLNETNKTMFASYKYLTKIHN